MSSFYGIYDKMDIGSLRTAFQTYANSEHYSVVFECNGRGDEYWTIKAQPTEQVKLDDFFNSEYRKWNVTNRSATIPNSPITSTVDKSTTPHSIDTQSIEVHYHVFEDKGNEGKGNEDKGNEGEGKGNKELIIQATGRCAKCDECINSNIGKPKMHEYCHIDKRIPKYKMKQLFSDNAGNVKAIAKILFNTIEPMYTNCYKYCPINDGANYDVCDRHYNVKVRHTTLNDLINLKSTKAYIPPKEKPSAAAESRGESSASLPGEPVFNFYHLLSFITYISSSKSSSVTKLINNIKKVLTRTGGKKLMLLQY